MITGYAHRPSNCQCEDFPCCGHNDCDPNWQPDPYDEAMQHFYVDDQLPYCDKCDTTFTWDWYFQRTQQGQFTICECGGDIYEP